MAKMVRKTIMVAAGNGDGGGKKKRKTITMNKATLVVAARAIGLGVVGAIGTGIASAIVDRLGPLARYAARGPTERAVVLLPVSLAVTGAGLAVAAKMMKGPAVARAAVPILVGAGLTALAIPLASMVVDRVERLVTSVMGASTPIGIGIPTPAGSGLLTASDVRRRLAQIASSTPGGLYASDDGLSTGGELRRPGGLYASSDDGLSTGGELRRRAF